MTTCPSCKSEIRDEARFCGSCGAAIGAAPSAPKHGPAPHAPQPAQQGSRVPKYLLPPRGVVVGAPAPRTVVAPAASGAPLWDMQRSLMGSAETLSASLGRSLPRTSGFGGAVHRMLRAALLDANVYREASNNASRTAEAAVVAGVALLCVATGPAIFTLVSSLNVAFILALLGVQALFLAAFVAGAALLAPTVASKKIDPLGLFRPIAYAQSVGILAIVPVVGPFLALWRLVTMTAAIKDAAGVETGKAVMLLVVGLVCGVVAVKVLGPTLFGAVGGWGVWIQ